MNAREYYLAVQSVIHAAPHVLRSDVQFDEVDVNECYIRGILWLSGSLELHIAEYVVTAPTLERLKYRFHLQTLETRHLVRRWDNAPHHSQVTTFPHHCHDENEIVRASVAMDIAAVLDAILNLVV